MQEVLNKNGRGAHFKHLPVGPNPPVRNASFGKQETANKQKDQEEEAAASAGDNFIPCKSPQGSEHANAHAVHHEEQQDVGEEPAT